MKSLTDLDTRNIAPVKLLSTSIKVTKIKKGLGKEKFWLILRIPIYWLRQEPKVSRCRLSVRASVRHIPQENIENEF